MEYSFDMKNIIQTAFILNVHVDEIIDASKRTTVIFETLSTPLWNVVGNPVEYMSAHCWKNLNADTIVATCSGTPNEYQQVFILAYAYLVTKPNIKNNIGKVKTFLEDFRRRSGNIRNHESNIASYMSAIRTEYEGMYRLSLNTQNMQLMFKKICKRLKVKYEFADDLHRFTFKNITIGNDTEGYLKYKTVTVITNDDFVIKEIIYGFNGFSFSTSWGFSLIGHLHPHINVTNICYGNRSGDHTLYKTTGAYDFLLLLIKESLETYDSHSPYEHLGNIIRRVEVLESIVQMGDVQENGVIITHESNPRRYTELLLSKIKRCPHCNSMLMANPIDPHASISCTNLSCHANPNAELKCRSCETILTRGSWSQARQQYNYECHNTRQNCSQSVEAKEYEKYKKRIAATIKKVKEQHFTIGQFTDKTGYDRRAVMRNGAYIPCPYCGEPLGEDYICVTSVRGSRCRGYRWYTLDLNYDLYDKLVEDYMNSTDKKIPEIPDDLYYLEYETGSNIIGRLLGKEYCRLHPETSIEVLRYDSTYAYHYNSGEAVLRYREFYTEYLQSGNARISHVDAYFKRLDIEI